MLRYKVKLNSDKYEVIITANNDELAQNLLSRQYFKSTSGYYYPTKNIIWWVRE